MTTETINNNIQSTQIEINKSYEEYVDKAVQEGLDAIKYGNVQDFDEAMKELDKELFPEYE